MDLVTSNGKEAPLRPCRKAHKRMRDGKKKKPQQLQLKWELESEEANKTLYMCVLEHGKDTVAYVVRTIKLSDLLSSSPVDDPLPLRQVAYEAGSHLAGSVGCGVLGSQIVFAGGVQPSSPYGIGPHLTWPTNVYAFETHRNAAAIRKLDANLQGAKFGPLTVELGGKLYVLSHWMVGDPPSFEVFDPQIGRWEGLPQPPFHQIGSPYRENGNFSYAIAGTKIFASHDKQCPVFCFDVARPNTQWRIVPTMCNGGSFSFDNKALVLDLQGDDDKKIMFAYCVEPWRLQVYLMSLSENHESITKIGDVRIPRVPYELGWGQCCKLLHTGGNKVCLVVTQIASHDGDDPNFDVLSTYHKHAAVIPFQFHLDMSRVDMDKRNCLTLQFMPLRILEYHTNPSTLPEAEVVGCFLL